MKSLPGRFEGEVTYHDSCSGLRELGVQAQPRALLALQPGVKLVEMKDARACCGFGGTFAAKYGDISTAIVDEKSVCNPPEWKQYAACLLTRHHPFARKPTPFTLLFESPPIHSPVPTSPTRRFVATQSHLSKAVPRSLRGQAQEPYRARQLEGLAKSRRS
jgi:hypothetical protein